MRPRPSFAGAAIEVSDLGRSVAFHRLWLPMLGFRRVWAWPDRVMWSRGYDHFVMRQAKEGISYGPGALWLAVSAESRGQVDQVFAARRTPEGVQPTPDEGILELAQVTVDVAEQVVEVVALRAQLDAQVGVQCLGCQ